MRSLPAPATVALRQPKVSDLPLLGAWNAALIRDERPDNLMSADQLVERIREWRGGESDARILVCRGVDACYALYRDLQDLVHLRQFYVAPEWRRRGVGTAALGALRLEFPADKGMLVEAMAWNEPAFAFWRATGFADRYVGLESRPGGSPRR